jgi:hypothetical protein
VLAGAVGAVVGSVDVDADVDGAGSVGVVGAGDPDVAVVAGCVGEADVLPPLALVEMDEDWLDVADAGLEVADAGLEVADVGLEVADAGLEVGGVGVVVVGDEDVAVGVAEGLVDSDGSCSASHDCLLAGGVAALAAAARLTPETAVSRKLPATRATAAGRGCANRMKRLPLLLATARNGSLDSACPTRLARMITACGNAAGFPWVRAGDAWVKAGHKCADREVATTVRNV